MAAIEKPRKRLRPHQYGNHVILESMLTRTLTDIQPSIQAAVTGEITAVRHDLIAYKLNQLTTSAKAMMTLLEPAVKRKDPVAIEISAGLAGAITIQPGQTETAFNRIAEQDALDQQAGSIVNSDLQNFCKVLLNSSREYQQQELQAFELLGIAQIIEFLMAVLALAGFVLWSGPDLEKVVVLIGLLVFWALIACLVADQQDRKERLRAGKAPHRLLFLASTMSNSLQHLLVATSINPQTVKYILHYPGLIADVCAENPALLTPNAAVAQEAVLE